MVALPILKVRVKGKHNRNQSSIIRGALLDTGSDRTFCTRKIAKQLQEKGKRVKLSLSTISEKMNELDTEEIWLKITSVAVKGVRSIIVPNVLVIEALPELLRSLAATFRNIREVTHLQGITVLEQLP